VDIYITKDRPARAGRIDDTYSLETELKREPLTYRHWRLPNRAAVFEYVHSMGEEVLEWLCALYVDEGLNLLAVETLAIGEADQVHLNFGDIICRGRAHQAAGFILVHNHPSGDPNPSRSDMEATARLRQVSEELDVPLLDHFIVAGDQMKAVGNW